jgi:hypothetical protein
MSRLMFSLLLAIGVAFACSADRAEAQLAPLTQISVDANWGPICAGIPEPFFGPAPCGFVQKELQVRSQIPAILPTLPFLGMTPQGPLCNGPLGPGPCVSIARWIALQQLAANQVQMPMVIANAPGVGPICAGPLGPGPCEAVRAYLMQASLGAGVPAMNLRAVTPVGVLPMGLGPSCNGPFGPVPCHLLGQFGLDGIVGDGIPARTSFGLPTVSDAMQLAQQCANIAKLDIGAFAGCTGQQVVLTGRQHAILDCAVSNSTMQNFAACAAKESGVNLSDDQRLLARCAVQSQGQSQSFLQCAGSSFAGRLLTSDEQAILACGAAHHSNSAAFAQCATPRFLGRQERATLECAMNAGDLQSFASCAAPNIGVSMSNDQRVLARCALSSGGDATSFAACAGTGMFANGLGPREQAVLGCAVNASGDRARFASCAAQNIFGSKLSKEQSVAIRCAAESGGDAASFGGCAAANLVNLQLNPEQQIAVQCAIGSGGNPPAAAGCIASRLTLRELSKCLSDGVGGSGCFGDSNDLVGKNGFVRRSLAQVAGGPNSIINNPNQIWGGDNSFVRNPAQIWGGPNSFFNNPSQVFGGPNSVFNNPGQLVPKPKPVQIGTVGGKRICLPWC